MPDKLILPAEAKPVELTLTKRRAVQTSQVCKTFTNQNLAATFAPRSTFIRCRFVDCRLDLAVFAGAVFSECEFDTCLMAGVNFREASVKGCTFTGCYLVGAAFDGARLQGTGFASCILESATFLGAMLGAPVSFVSTSLRNADLRFYESDEGQPNIADCDLNGASFSVNCEFWNGTFDERATKDFGLMWGRASRDAEIIEWVKKLWGAEAYDQLDRYMRRR